MLICASYTLTVLTNSSVLYHMLRGQNSLKITMLKGVIEIIDILMKNYGEAVTDNFSRALL